MSFLFSRLSEFITDKILLAQFSSEELKRHRFVPLYVQGDILHVAVDTPFNPILEHLQKNWQQVQLHLVVEKDIDLYFEGAVSQDALTELIEEAIKKKVSDVHISSRAEGGAAHFRIDGRLSAYRHYGDQDYDSLKALIKLHGHFDISISTQPQDGRLSHVYQGQRYDVRVASLPTVYGEDFVFRFFQGIHQHASLAELGFDTIPQDYIGRMLAQESGLILVTGSTGSGKTTTVYSFLSQLISQKAMNIVSLEDPVEALIEGVRQSQINPAIGYTFEKGLKAILRQDPDCICLGEIRDAQTAKIALEAAYTGHLVIATLHTSDCQNTLLRLRGFGLDPFLVGYALKGIISQKLVLKVCKQCQGKTCTACQEMGHAGRTVWSEILYMPRAFCKNPFDDIQEFIDAQLYDSFEADWQRKKDRNYVVDSA